MKSKTKIKKLPKKAQKELSKLNRDLKRMPGVMVGLPKGSPEHEAEDGSFTSIIDIGFVHEFGIGVHERSFLRSTIVGKKRKYKQLMKKLVKKVIRKELSSKDAMGLLGDKLSGDVKEKITDIKSPSITHREGNPLVDTGQLRKSITYVTR